MNEKNNITKTAMLTVCGRPNVGKSSLTNALVGEKIAIVSNKPQTTRNRIYGVVNRGDTQFILLDTPGLHKARSRLGDYMVKVVRESLASVEAALLLVEPIPTWESRRKSFSSASGRRSCPAYCASTRSTPWSARTICWRSSPHTARPTRISTHHSHLRPHRRRSGGSAGPDAAVRRGRAAAVPRRHDHRPAGSAVCAEIIREKMLLCLDKEIPHGTAVEVTRFTEREDTGIIDLDVTIYCEKASHKASSSASTGICSSASAPWPAGTSKSSWAPRCTWKPGSRSKKTGGIM